MQTPHFFPLGEGLELTEIERQEDQLVLHVTATSSTARCPLCGQPANRLHRRYRRVVKDLPCPGQQVQLILHVRKFFCDTVACTRKVFAERLAHLVAPWAQMTTRLTQALQSIGLATCGRLGARLASHLGITTSWMTIVRRVMALPTPKAQHVECVGLDDFAFRPGNTGRWQAVLPLWYEAGFLPCGHHTTGRHTQPERPQHPSPSGLAKHFCAVARAELFLARYS